jgi:hypothetical protein
MLIDFSPVNGGQLTMLEFSEGFTLDDLRAAASAYIDAIFDIIADADDAQIAFIPDDPEADDPYAVEGEERIGWSLGHLIAHVTASTEEGVTFASLLARGIQPPDENLRLRDETPWRAITTRAGAVQRLEESRRLRLAYLDTWPDHPHLDLCRRMRPDVVERHGQWNAPASVLVGLWHEHAHLDQMRKVLQQARDATASTAHG